MSTGDIEVNMRDIKVLNNCKKELPFHVQDFHEVKHVF